MVVGAWSLFGDRTDSALQFVLGLVSLLLGDHTRRSGWASSSRPAAEQLGDERTRLRDVGWHTSPPAQYRGDHELAPMSKLRTADCLSSVITRRRTWLL